MKNDQEWQRLQTLYGGMDDSELTRLFEQRDSLTEVARNALTAEFHARGLTLERDETGMPAAEAPIDGSLFPLWDFLDDATGADEAVALLEDYEIHADLKPVRTELRRSDATPAISWKLSVAAADKARAIELLRKHRGLFPLAEAHDLDASFLPDEHDLFVVGEFDVPEDAALAESGLRAGSVAFRRRDEQHDGKTISTIEVAQADVDRAGEAMEQAFLATGPVDLED